MDLINNFEHAVKQMERWREDLDHDASNAAYYANEAAKARHPERRYYSHLMLFPAYAYHFEARHQAEQALRDALR